MSPCATVHAGEIVARGPQMMQGYWNAPEQTAQALRGGWLHTGGAGFVDAEGYVYVRDRIKDMIVTGGSNVYSVEVEVVLADHPGIADVAVIGVPDPQWGERVTAVVVPRDGAMLTLDDVQEHCRARLGGYKIPATARRGRRASAERQWQGAEARTARAVLGRAGSPRRRHHRRRADTGLSAPARTL